MIEEDLQREDESDDGEQVYNEMKGCGELLRDFREFKGISEIEILQREVDRARNNKENEGRDAFTRILIRGNKHL